MLRQSHKTKRFWYQNASDDSSSNYMSRECVLIRNMMKRIDELRYTRDKVFQVPPFECIEERISQFRDLLELNINDSTIVLRRILGPMEFEANYPEIGKPYYLAHNSTDVLAIFEPSPTAEVRTMAQIHSSGGHGRKEFEPPQIFGSGLTCTKARIGVTSVQSSCLTPNYRT